MKTIQISRDGSNQSHTMLKTTFLKKTENYVCQMTKFITNITPKLNADNEIMFEILPRGDQNTQVVNAIFPNYWKDEWRQFRPSPYYSVTELAVQIRRFFHRFGFLVRKVGTTDIQGELDQNGINQTAYPFVPRNITHDDGFVNTGYEELDDEGRMVNFKLLPDGRFSLQLTAEFSSNFYIRVGNAAQKKTGYPEYLFVTEGAQLRTAQDGVEYLFEDGQFTYDSEVEEPYDYETRFAMNNYDDRLSLDIVMTIPISNQISIVDGREEHEYILARFDLSDYKRFDTLTTLLEDRVSSQITIVEDINVGLEDLARNNPNQSTIFMMPGDIRQISLRLYTRYYQEGRIKRVETNMDQGFWSTKLLFTKKQT
jgi:hypothetical protein